jgi:hypothetical protein
MMHILFAGVVSTILGYMMHARGVKASARSEFGDYLVVLGSLTVVVTLILSIARG